MTGETNNTADAAQEEYASVSEHGQTGNDYYIPGVKDDELYKSVGVVDIVEKTFMKPFEKLAASRADAVSMRSRMLESLRARQAEADVAAARSDIYENGSLVPIRQGFWGRFWYEINKPA